MKLEKAYLKALNDKVPDIRFMFNPTELAFKHKVNFNSDNGARSDSAGRPKISFSGIESREIQISNIMFDTYEEREDVHIYIRPFLCAVSFVESVQKHSSRISSDLISRLGNPTELSQAVHQSIASFRSSRSDDNDLQSPPVYRFIWGNQDQYLPYCFIDSLDYKFTMFLPDGTPVRAVISSLTLKETDGRSHPQLGNVSANRELDSLGSRLGSTFQI
jgi:hypothetical protein